jgi:hypothetical protein
MQPISINQVIEMLKITGRWLLKIPLMLLQLMALSASFALLLLCIYFLIRLFCPIISLEPGLVTNNQSLFPTSAVATSLSLNPLINNAPTQQVGKQKNIKPAITNSPPSQPKDASSEAGHPTTTSADSISALSIVVAVVTLLLSLSTTWIANRQKELSHVLQELDDKNQREEMRLHLIELRLMAQSELLEYFLA